MAIPVKRWQRDSLPLPSPPLLLALSLHWPFQEELCTESVIVFSRLFSFWVWERLISWRTRGKAGQKDRKRANRKWTKVSRGEKSDRRRTVRIHSHTWIFSDKHNETHRMNGIMWKTGESASVSPRTLESVTNQGLTEICDCLLCVHMQNSTLLQLIHYYFHSKAQDRRTSVVINYIISSSGWLTENWCSAGTEYFHYQLICPLLFRFVDDLFS